MYETKVFWELYGFTEANLKVIFCAAQYIFQGHVITNWENCSQRNCK